MEPLSVPRLLIVAHYFAPWSDTSAQRSTRLARFLAERGVPPVVVTAAPELYGDTVVPGRSLRDDLKVHEVTGGRSERWVRRCGPPGRYAANLLLQRAYRRAVQRALDAGPAPDFIYWWGVPFWYFPLAPGFSRRTGIPSVLDFGDVWHMRGVAYRLGMRWGARRLADWAAESWSVRRADLSLFTTDEQTQLYRERYPDCADRFVTVLCGFDAGAMAQSRPMPRSAGAFRIAIVGRFSVYSSADATALAQAVAGLRGEREVEVVHVGRPEPALAQAFEQEGAGASLHPMGVLSYEQCLSVLKSADCGVASPLSDVSVSVKVYDYIGAGLPILAFALPDSALAHLLAGVPNAFVVQDAAGAARVLRQIAPGVGGRRAGPAAAKYSSQHQFELLVGRLARLMEEPAGKGAGPCAC